MDEMWITAQPEVAARLSREKLDLLLGVGESYGDRRVLDVIASPAAVSDFEVKGLPFPSKFASSDLGELLLGPIPVTTAERHA